MPYAQYKELLKEVEESDAFDRWRDGKIVASKIGASPISLLLLASLRYLGREWTFDDLGYSREHFYQSRRHPSLFLRIH